MLTFSLILSVKQKTKFSLTFPISSFVLYVFVVGEKDVPTVSPLSLS